MELGALEHLSMRSKTIFTLCIVVFLSFTIRYIGLSTTPPGVNWDEASLGYNAYSILKTGRDEWGIVAPLIFRAFGDYKLPIYVYFDVLPIYLFDLNPISTRIPSVIFGTITCLSIFIVIYQITKNKTISLFSSVLIGLTPWTIWLSRIGLEGNVALSLFILGLAVILRNTKSNLLFLGIIFMCLTLFTYNSYRIITPIILCALIFSHKDIINKRRKIISALIFLVFITPVLIQFTTGTGSARYKWVELINPGVISALEEKRNTTRLPGGFEKLIYNKPSYIISTVLTNHLLHFSPNFLFIKGGSNYQFNVVNFPLISPILLPLIYLGIWSLIRSINIKNLYLIVLLVISPIPASITLDAPHTLRASMLILPLVIALSIFLTRFNEKIRKKIIIVSLVGLLTTLCVYVANWHIYNTQYYWAWQYGHDHLSYIVKQKYDQVDEIIITKRYGEPHIFILYDLAWDPKEYLADKNLDRYYRSNWYWVDKFDKFKFVNDWEIVNYTANLEEKKSYLIVSSPENKVEGTSYVVSSKSGIPIYFITQK